ncbi:MAG: dihydroorotate dehydrogenase [Bacteroidales bacterium]|nr:dihydroorotate dehydrogenase [Bacteroidales bacterium]
MADLAIRIGKIKFKNPVMTASGTFGFGPEFDDFIDVSRIGAVLVKGITGSERQGNPYPRMAETASGMLNTVGLQNKGIDYFVEKIYPEIIKYDTEIIVNVNGGTIEEYCMVAEKCNKLERINAIELNISCPNVTQGGMIFGTHCPSTIAVTDAVRKSFNKTLIVKLSPNVTDIVEFAQAVEGCGADAVSLINTLLGMAIDAKTHRSKLSTITGGLSGPAVKPIALRMVWQVANAVKIPVIGIGGIMNTNDAIEFFLAGASAVQIGTANFINPAVTIEIIDGINRYLNNKGFSSIHNLIGALEV